MKQIDFKFLESGHTQMEVDSMHATIERAASSVDIFVPRDWCIIAATAKKNGAPYQVNRMTNTDIIDFKHVSQRIITNRSTAVDGSTVNWTHLKWIQFSKDSVTMKVKYELNDSPFTEVMIRRQTRGRQLHNEDGFLNLMKPLYTKPIAISKPKYDDLQDLCRKFVIPQEFHAYYAGLIHSATVRDVLNEPDVEETVSDDE